VNRSRRSVRDQHLRFVRSARRQLLVRVEICGKLSLPAGNVLENLFDQADGSADVPAEQVVGFRLNNR
jgi:hypothetical protein